MKKFEGIKMHDRVRVTFEGSILAVGMENVSFHTDGGDTRQFSSASIESPTFHVERLKQPLSVGDNVTGKPGSAVIGRILAVHGDSAWVQWPFVNKACTEDISTLERIA